MIVRYETAWSGFDSHYMIPGWAVALTYYISQSTKHMKIADFDPSGSQNP